MSWPLRSWLLAGLVAIGCANAGAAPAIEGVVQPVNPRVADLPLSAPGILWRGEVKVDSNATFFRLHFSNLSVNGDAQFRIVIRNVAGLVLADIGREEFATRPDYWSPYLSGNYALIELVSPSAAPATRVAFKIPEAGIETEGARVLSRQNDNDPKDEPLWRYESNAPLMAAARAVAKLRYTRDDILYSCTGFLVTNDLLVTNEHCIRSNADCASAIAQFGYVEDAAMNRELGENYACERLEDSDPGLDFAVLRLRGSPGGKWGLLKWQVGSPTQGAATYLVQHPNGRPKRIARDGCLIKTASAVGRLPGKLTDLGHTCDSETGSSGSPLLDESFQVVGLHHLGFDTANARWVKENRAVKASILAARLASITSPPH